MDVIRKVRLRCRNNRKISGALREQKKWSVERRRRRGILPVLAAGLALGLAAPAVANPAPRGQQLVIYPGGNGTQGNGDAYGSEHTDARLYFDGAWHSWSGCFRSTWSVHLWTCNNMGSVPVGHYAYAEFAYHNANGWSYGNSPWVYSECCESHQATTGTLG